MYIIYIPVALLSYILFNDMYNKYCVKFIVVSNNDYNTLKIHTKPVPLNKAINIQKSLKNQYYYQTVNGFPIHKDVFIMKFIKFK